MGNDGIHNPPLFPFIVLFPRSSTQANLSFTHPAVTPSCADSHVSCAPPPRSDSGSLVLAIVARHSLIRASVEKRSPQPCWLFHCPLWLRPPTTLPLSRRQLSSRPNKVSLDSVCLLFHTTAIRTLLLTHARIVSCNNVLATLRRIQTSLHQHQHRTQTTDHQQLFIIFLLLHHFTKRPFLNLYFIPSLPNHRGHTNTITNLVVITAFLSSFFTSSQPKNYFKEPIRIQSNCTIIICVDRSPYFQIIILYFPLHIIHVRHINSSRP